MAYLKFSRDKRGYEHFYLVQPANRGKGRPRMLYWFRTPPGVKVGRSPFDADMRRALEAQNPDVVFDWDAIIHTPIPPPVEPERWRERRRVERASRAAEAEEAVSVADRGEEPGHIEIKSETMSAEPTVQPGAVESDELMLTAEPLVAYDMTSALAGLPEPPELPEPQELTGSTEPEPDTAPGVTRPGHRRRRRRRGRRRPQGQETQGSGFQVQGSGFSDQGSGVPVPGSEVPVRGPESKSSESPAPAVQDSGEPPDHELKREPEP